MYAEIKRRIFYDTQSGTVLLDIGHRSGWFEDTTVDFDIRKDEILSRRVDGSFSVIELDEGQFEQDFRECNGYRVNPDTQELEFSYPDPNDEQPSAPVYQKPLSIEVEETKARITDLELTIAEMMTQ